MARGLKSIDEAREQRKQSRYGTPSPMFVLALAGSALAAVIFYVVRTEQELESGKTKLLAERQAAMVTVGVEWQKLRNELERIVLEAGKVDDSSDFIAPELRGKSIEDRPSIYVRLRLKDAKNAEAFRAAMDESVRDGFTTCFFKQEAEAPSHSALAGVADAGELLEQPWNLRQGIKATRVLEEPWATDVKNAGDEMRLRALARDYEYAKKTDIPLAIDITQRSEYFVFLLDEEPESDPVRSLDGGAGTLDDVMRVPHTVRVNIVELGKNKKNVLRVRRVAQGAYRMVGSGSKLPEETEAAMKRQVNNCALAATIKEALQPNQ